MMTLQWGRVCWDAEMPSGDTMIKQSCQNCVHYDKLAYRKGVGILQQPCRDCFDEANRGVNFAKHQAKKHAK